MTTASLEDIKMALDAIAHFDTFTAHVFNRSISLFIERDCLPFYLSAARTGILHDVSESSVLRILDKGVVESHVWNEHPKSLFEDEVEHDKDDDELRRLFSHVSAKLGAKYAVRTYCNKHLITIEYSDLLAKDADAVVKDILNLKNSFTGIVVVVYDGYAQMKYEHPELASKSNYMEKSVTNRKMIPIYISKNINMITMVKEKYSECICILIGADSKCVDYCLESTDSIDVFLGKIRSLINGGDIGDVSGSTSFPAIGAMG
jgi:hypothetical protein